MKMKKYIAIGHFKEDDNIRSVSMKQNTIKDFRTDLKCNGFVAYIVISENKFNQIKNKTGMELFEEVKKMTTNYRKWILISDYFEDCMDIIEEKVMKAV